MTTKPTPTRDALDKVISAFSGQNSNLTIPRVYITLTGSIESALLLSQIIYWTDRATMPDGWFAKSYDEWQEELTLSKYQVMKAVKPLKIAGVSTVIKKFNGAPTVHYHLDREVLSQWIVKKLDNPKSENLTIESQETSQSSTETTSETTAINTTSAEKPADDTAAMHKETIAEFVETLEVDGLANTGNTPPDDLPQDDKPAKKQRARDPIYDAIAEVWPKAENGMIICVKSMLLGTAKRGLWKDCNFDVPATTEEILRFGQWCKSNKKGMANQPHLIQNWFYEFRRHEAAKQKIPAAAGFDLSQWQAVTFNPNESYGD